MFLIDVLVVHAVAVLKYVRAICKVHGLTLLLQVRTLWWCSDCLFSKVTLVANYALLTVLHPLLKNVLQTIDHFEISCIGEI